MINYTSDMSQINKSQLNGFFVGWPDPPDPKAHLEILKNSYCSFVAIDENMNVVGFINAISDSVLCAYIPLLEVLPECQKQGIGSKLVELMLERLNDFYMVDLTCDENMVGYYESTGMVKARAMMKRNFDQQSGISK